jgi:GAF domain-containing protein
MDGSSIPVEVAASRIRLQGHPAVQMIANDISERKRTNQKIETQLKRLAALHEIDSAISGSFDLRSIITLILDKTINQLNVDAARVLLLNLYTHTLDQISSLGFHTRGNRYRDTRLGLGFASRAVLEHRVISINDINDTHEYPNERSLWESEGFCAYHGAPLIVKGDVKGVLEVFSRPISNTQERDTEWLYFLETLAGQAAIAVDNSELFEGLQRANVELVLAYR